MAGSHRSRPADSKPSQPASAPGDARQPAPSEAEPSSSMLSDVLAQTSERLAAPQDLPADVHAALVAVVRQYAGQPLALDPVGVALVGALLKSEFPILAERPPLLARTARAVAQSLLGDPDASRRVEHLWAQLAEECA